MPKSMSPHLAVAAVVMRRHCPQLPARALLDALMDRRVGALEDFDPHLSPGSPFAALVAEAFDSAGRKGRWQRWPSVPQQGPLWQSQLAAWKEDLLPRFVATYGVGV